MRSSVVDTPPVFVGADSSVGALRPQDDYGIGYNTYQSSSTNVHRHDFDELHADVHAIHDECVRANVATDQAGDIHETLQQMEIVSNQCGCEAGYNCEQIGWGFGSSLHSLETQLLKWKKKLSRSQKKLEDGVSEKDRAQSKIDKLLTKIRLKKARDAVQVN